MSLEHRTRSLYGENLAAEKEIKVRIPLTFHIKLHTIKVLHGQSISSTVRQALEAYFREFDGVRSEELAQRRIEAWDAPPPAAPAALPPSPEGVQQRRLDAQIRFDRG